MRGDDLIRDATSDSETETPLDRLWEATRPATPSAHDWDRVWTTVSAELDQAGSRDVVAFAPPARRLGLAAVGLILVGQAAAVLLALGLSLGRFDAEPGADRAEPRLAARRTVRSEAYMVVAFAVVDLSG